MLNTPHHQRETERSNVLVLVKAVMLTSEVQPVRLSIVLEVNTELHFLVLVEMNPTGGWRASSRANAWKRYPRLRIWFWNTSTCPTPTGG